MKSRRPRLSIDVTIRQHEFLKMLPFGWRQQIFSSLIDMLIETVDRCGLKALGVIASKSIKLEKYFNEEL